MWLLRIGTPPELGVCGSVGDWSQLHWMCWHFWQSTWTRDWCDQGSCWSSAIVRWDLVQGWTAQRDKSGGGHVQSGQCAWMMEAIAVRFEISLLIYLQPITCLTKKQFAILTCHDQNMKSCNAFSWQNTHHQKWIIVLVHHRLIS